MSQKKIKQERKKLEEENAFLQMKLTAEHGAVFGGLDNLSPEMMNQFLKNVMKVEEEDQKRKNNKT